MRRIALFCMCMAGAAEASDWTVLTGNEIAAALEGQKLEYTNGAWQDFRKTGRTLCNAGRDGWGYWNVSGDQYCSMWPPSDLWACYDVHGSGDKIRFVGESKDVTEGIFIR